MILRSSRFCSSTGFAKTPTPSVHGTLRQVEWRTDELGGRAPFQLVSQNSNALRSKVCKTFVAQRKGADAHREWSGGPNQGELCSALWVYLSCIWSRPLRKVPACIMRPFLLPSLTIRTVCSVRVLRQDPAALLLHRSMSDSVRALPEAELHAPQLCGAVGRFDRVGRSSRCMGSVNGSVDRGGYLALFWLFEPVECELFASEGCSVLGTLDSHILPSKSSRLGT